MSTLYLRATPPSKLRVTFHCDGTFHRGLSILVGVDIASEHTSAVVELRQAFGEFSESRVTMRQINRISHIGFPLSEHWHARNTGEVFTSATNADFTGFSVSVTARVCGRTRERKANMRCFPVKRSYSVQSFDCLVGLMGDCYIPFDKDKARSAMDGDIWVVRRLARRCVLGVPNALGVLSGALFGESPVEFAEPLTWPVPVVDKMSTSSYWALERSRRIGDVDLHRFGLALTQNKGPRLAIENESGLSVSLHALEHILPLPQAQR